MNLDQLSHASFKGVRFPCNDTSTTAGPALIKHQYANSDTVAIESQGRNPRDYTVVAIITGEGYAELRDRLLAAIEDPTPGVLIHPFYGRIENAVAFPVTFDETVKALGRTEIPISFGISRNPGAPAAATLSPRRLSALKTGLTAAVAEDFAGRYAVTPGLVGNYSYARQKLVDFADKLQSVTAITARPAAFVAELQAFRRNIDGLLRVPAELAGQITGLIDSIAGLYDSAGTTFSVSRGLFDFGSTDRVFDGSTVGLNERQTSADALNQAVRASALAVAYEAAAFREYRTVDDVDAAARALEAGYRGLTLAIAPRNAADALRNASRQYLTSQKLTAARVVTVNSPRQSARLLSFAYYGDSAQAADIVAINANVNTPYYAGAVKVLTE